MKCTEFKNVKTGLGISVKLIFMATLIVVSAIGVVVYKAVTSFEDDSLIRVQVMNKDVVGSISDQVFGLFKDVTDKAGLMTETVAQAVSHGGTVNADAEQTVQNVLRANDDIVSFAIYTPEGKSSYKELYFATKDEALAEFNVSRTDLRTKPSQAIFSAVNWRPDEVSVVNISPLFKTPLLSVAFLTKKSSNSWLIRCDIRQDAFIKLFTKRDNTTVFMVNRQGDVVVHSDPLFSVTPTNLANFPIVQHVRVGKTSTEQMVYEGDQGESYYGAYRLLNVGGLGVVAQIEKSKALATVMKVQKESMLITLMVVGIAFIFNFLFSRSLTKPIEDLYFATGKIAKGEFDLNLRSNSDDEIGVLTRAFKKMAAGLQERDKLKGAFDKFQSKEIAQKIMSGEIKLGGEKRVATVCFTDIRNFTSMSEQMSPDQVVQMLNEYMTEMVKIIYKHQGVVYKYIGDAIMAVWGVPQTKGDEPVRAVLAALEMRSALTKLNERRQSKDQPALHVGIGIHTGDVLAGNIGSEERLEYTVIGDTVNQASRIESANKDLSSDILVSEATQRASKERLVFGPPQRISVKGKSQSLTVYQVIGKRDASGNVQTDLTADQQSAIQNVSSGQNSGTQTGIRHGNSVVISGIPDEHDMTIENNGQTEVIEQRQQTRTMPNFAPQARTMAPAQPQPQSFTFSQTNAGVPGFGQQFSEGTFAGQVQNVWPGAQQMPVQQMPMQQMPQQMHSQQIHPIQPMQPITFPQMAAPQMASGVMVPQMAAQVQQQQIDDPQIWYLVRDTRTPNVEGPFSLGQLRHITQDPQFPFSLACVYRDGDSQMTPLTMISQLSRRQPAPPPPTPLAPPSMEQVVMPPDHWYVSLDGATIIGPYSQEQLRAGSDNGSLHQTVLCWKQGMPQWIYLFQVPGFDRRTGRAA